MAKSGTPALSRRRRWLYRLSAATLVPLIVLGVFEIVLRLCGYGYPAGYFVSGGREFYVANPFYGRHFFPQGRVPAPPPCRVAAVKADHGYRIFVLGESAAQGFPDSSVSFARILEVMLRERYPAARFEVVNTAMTAINSHVVLPIARDCGRHEPDLFVVYMGNNEVVGPFGTAGVLGPFAANRKLIGASIAAKSLRLGQFLSRQTEWAMGTSKIERWEGMAMFAESRVRADDPRMETLYANFADNLRDICGVGRRAGAQVIVCTVGTNLKDSAPFASSEDSGGADAHFLKGRELLAKGQLAEAREQFVQARDLDMLRFRADSRINDAIRSVADSDGEGVHLVDADAAFAKASADGIPGENLFYEHVHMNFHGNYVLAQAVFEQVAGILPDWVTSQSAGQLVLSEKECMERLAFGDARRLQALEILLRIMRDPPFRGQLDCTERNERMRRRLEQLRKGFETHGAEQALADFRRALKFNDDDIELHRDFGEFLVRFGEFREAAVHLQRVVNEEPGVASGYLKLAFALKGMRSFEQALDMCGQAGRLDPDMSDVENLKGAIFTDMGKRTEALAAFRRAIQINPQSERAHFNLGLILAADGQLGDAMAAYSEALRLLPDYPEAHLKLAEIHARRQEYDRAITHFRAALKLDPNLIDAHIGLGITAFKQDRLDDALDHYRAALAVNPKLPMVHYGIAGILAMQGKRKDAIGHMEEALRLQPDWPEARQALEEMRQK